MNEKKKVTFHLTALDEETGDWLRFKVFSKARVSFRQIEEKKTQFINAGFLIEYVDIED